MAKPPKKPKLEEVETEPDAWERFERTMGKIVPPKPHKDKAKQGSGARALSRGKKKSGAS